MKRQKPQKDWLNRKTVLMHLKIKGQSFDAWKVQSVGKIGRETFYTWPDVIDNRVKHKLAMAEAEFQATYKDEEGSINPVVEKAKLDRERRIGQELANNEKAGSLFPTEAAGFVFSRMGVEIAAILDSLPANIKKRSPKMTATTIDTIKKEIAKTRNIAADVADRFDEFLDEYYS